MSQNTGFAVSEAVGASASRPAVVIDIRDAAHSWQPQSNALRVILDNLDEAQALRDALSAFLEFHKPRKTVEELDRELYLGADG